jgi:hypothetical protein
MGDVGRLAGRVDHQEQTVAEVGHHEVVEDAAGGVGEEGIALAPDAEADHVDRHHGLQPGRRARAGEDDLAHVGNVEQAGRAAGVGVLAEDAAGVLHRHFVAGEGRELGPAFPVQIVERRMLELALGFGHLEQVPLASKRRPASHNAGHPLCRGT